MVVVIPDVIDPHQDALIIATMAGEAGRGVAHHTQLDAPLRPKIKRDDADSHTTLRVVRVRYLPIRPRHEEGLLRVVVCNHGLPHC